MSNPTENKTFETKLNVGALLLAHGSEVTADDIDTMSVSELFALAQSIGCTGGELATHFFEADIPPRVAHPAELTAPTI